MTNKEQEQKNKEEVSDEIVNLVIARLETIPPNVAISVGKEGNFGVQELIEKVRVKDEIGKKIIDMELHYLRSLPELLTPKDIEKDVSDH